MKNNIIQYKHKFSDLNISKKNILKYLGYPGDEVPDPYPDMLEELLIVAEKLSNIKAGFVLFDNINNNQESKLLSINGLDFNIGNIISTSLKDSESVLFFVCTAGPGIEEYSRKLMKEDNTIEGYLMDVIGSETVEASMNYSQDLFEEMMKDIGLKITNRYSPGYCGWHVSEQHKLFSLLPEQFCDIKLKESALMLPIKSVSGIIGIGKNAEKKGYTCDNCDQENCVYRKGKF